MYLFPNLIGCNDFEKNYIYMYLKQESKKNEAKNNIPSERFSKNEEEKKEKRR